MARIFFMRDDALKTKERISKNIDPEHFLYGGFDLDKRRIAILEDYNLKNILKKKKGDIIITNRTKHIILMKILGVKIILIDINSNHDLTKGSGLKDLLKYKMYKKYYNLCDSIICLSQIQVEKLENIGAKNVQVIPLGVLKDKYKGKNKSQGYFLSSGGDQGKNHSFISKALEGFDVKILSKENLVSYKEYLKILKSCKALVLNVDATKHKSSDLSGTTTCFEALLAKKPIFINEQPWLKEFLADNYYVYKNEDDLRNLLKKNIKFHERDYSHLTLENFTQELLKIINQLKEN